MKDMEHFKGKKNYIGWGKCHHFFFQIIENMSFFSSVNVLSAIGIFIHCANPTFI